MRVFIVEDDPITLTLVSYMLTEEGIECKYALSSLSHSFYDELKEFNPDVIVLDVYLKDESALDLADKIKSDPFYSDVPILAMSASDSRDDRLSTILHGFSGYIHKPFTKKELLAFVKKYGHIHKVMALCDKIAANINRGFKC